MHDDSLQFDVIIVGGGPAGLACAIRLAQLNQEKQQPLSICLLDKGAQIGSHIVSGCVLDPRSLNKLIPDWKNLDTPVQTPVKKERFCWLTHTKSYALPIPPQLKNHGNYLISLSQLCQWLGSYAEKIGITIIPGYAAKTCLFNEAQEVIGIETGEMGVQRDLSHGTQYQPGVKILAKQVVLAEGCKGSVTEAIIKKYQLRKQSQPQSYAIGLKEVWQADATNYQDGLCVHTIGWPLDSSTYGGGFIYHYQNKIAVGLIIGLDYPNPTLDTHGELQRFKTHPSIAPMLKNGQCIAYAARALNEGGFQAIPQLYFPGGVIAGCAAGFLNIAQLKGTHNAMESGIIAAECIHEKICEKPKSIIKAINYQEKMMSSFVVDELKRARNIRPGFYRGRFFGLVNAAFETVTFGHSPWTLQLHEDYKQTQPLSKQKRLSYPLPDGKLTFSKTDSVRLTGTNHTENQPCHLIVKNPKLIIPVNYNTYGGPEQYYCPAKVYEYVDVNGKKRLQINAQNCIHCKTCAIKDPSDNIEWIPPQGGEGPKYSET